MGSGSAPYGKQDIGNPTNVGQRSKSTAGRTVSRRAALVGRSNLLCIVRVRVVAVRSDQPEGRPPATAAGEAAEENGQGHENVIRCV